MMEKLTTQERLERARRDLLYRARTVAEVRDAKERILGLEHQLAVERRDRKRSMGLIVAEPTWGPPLCGPEGHAPGCHPDGRGFCRRRTERSVRAEERQRQIKEARRGHSY